MPENKNGSPLLKVFHVQVKINGQLQLILMKLYASGVLEKSVYSG